MPLRSTVQVPGLDLPADGARAPVVNQVTPGYFRTVGLAVVEGRGLEDTDGPSDPRVAVVSRTMARALWPELESDDSVASWGIRHRDELEVEYVVRLAIGEPER